MKPAQVTLGQAAAMLRIAGPNASLRLRRILEALEKRTGKLFMLRTGGPVRVRHMVLLSVIRRYHPDLFTGAEDAEQEKKYAHTMEDIGRQMERMHEQLFDLNSKIELWGKHYSSEIGKLKAAMRSMKAA